MWVVTNAEQAASVGARFASRHRRKCSRNLMGRNTAAAIGLAALLLAHKQNDALMAVLPSDSYIADGAGVSQTRAGRA